MGDRRLRSVVPVSGSSTRDPRGSDRLVHRVGEGVAPPSDRQFAELLRAAEADIATLAELWPLLRQIRRGVRLAEPVDAPAVQPGRDGVTRVTAPRRDPTAEAAGRHNPEDGDLDALVEVLAALADVQKQTKGVLEGIRRLDGATRKVRSRPGLHVRPETVCPACRKVVRELKSDHCPACYASWYGWQNRKGNVGRPYEDWLKWRRKNLEERERTNLEERE